MAACAACPVSRMLSRTRVAHSPLPLSSLTHPCSTLVPFARGGSCLSRLASTIPRVPLPCGHVHITPPSPDTSDHRIRPMRPGDRHDANTLTHKSSQRPQRTPVRRALRSPLSSHRCSLLDDTSRARCRPAGVTMSRMRSLATLSARSTSSASPSHAPASVSRRLIRPHRETTRMHTASRSTAQSRSRYLTPK